MPPQFFSLRILVQILLLLFATSPAIAKSQQWTFTDGKATLARREAEGTTISFSHTRPIEKPIPFSPHDVLKISLTTTDGSGNTAARPHQAFVNVIDPITQLQTFFPFNVKGASPKLTISLSHKDLPPHLVDAESLDLSLVFASFSSIRPSMVPVTTLNPLLDPPTKELLQQQMHAALGESNVIYGPKPEIHYVFRPDAKSPPKLITLVFLSAVIAAYAGLFTTWFSLLGANYEHLPKAFKSSPVAHASFFSSLVAIEIIFFLYYTTWNLFQTLTASCAVGLVAFVSGSRALREVRSRRQGGER